jgi:thiol-disulfide isomerase/thioredoxin
VIRKFAVSALALMSSLMITTLAHAAKLGVGDKAPAIKVAKWLKGTPVASFQKGKVYVVEFWATWCPPCIESIPHLTDLAKKYKGKATFVGVSVSEAEPGAKLTSYEPKVSAFVKKMGAKMNYNVAVDGPQATMSRTVDGCRSAKWHSDGVCRQSAGEYRLDRASDGRTR